MSQNKKAPAPAVNDDLLGVTPNDSLLDVPLDLIDTAEQVRTIFDDDSIAELAADIKKRGVMQPLTLKAATKGRYLVIAGERRLRAAKLAELKTVPAIVKKVTAAVAADMQLAENIQREELPLQDLANAVRRLYDREKSVEAVAGIVNKSKSWVSKHLTMTMDNFSWQAKELLEDGVTEDLELLNTVSKLAEIHYGNTADLIKAIRAGEAGRKEARKVLADTKAAMKKETEEHLQRIAARQEKAQARTTEAAEKEPVFDPEETLGQILDQLRDTEEALPIEPLIAPYSAEQQAEMLAVENENLEKGKGWGSQNELYRLWTLANAAIGRDEMSTAAFIMGMTNSVWTLENLVHHTQGLLRTPRV